MMAIVIILKPHPTAMKSVIHDQAAPPAFAPQGIVPGRVRRMIPPGMDADQA
jgi:hypothetical protein